MNATKIKQIKEVFRLEHQVRLTTSDVYHLASIEQENLLGYELLIEYNCTLHKEDIEYLFWLLGA